MRAALAWILLLWLLPRPVSPHELKLSDSELILQGQEARWNHRVHLDDFEVKFGRAGDSEIKAYLPERLALAAGGKACGLQSVDLEKSLAQETVFLRLRYRCDSAALPLRVHYDLFYGDPKHRHLMKISEDSRDASFTFDPGDTDFELDAEGLSRQMIDFLKLGLEHILIGYDHILFVLALIFGARRFKDLVWLVSTFTLAHSITLALATLELLQLPPDLVEPAIAASIVLLASLDLLGGERSRSAMIALTFAFGLVHGLGFSYILQEANLRAGHLALPLIFFNLGVELGQLLIVSLVYPLTLALKALAGRFYRYLRWTALLAIGGMGLYWFLERVLP